jgi:hypothetical protein
VARVRAVIDLEASAHAYGAFQRPRGVRSAEALLRLALGYGPGGLSLRQAAAWAEMSELARLSRTALMNRLSRAADWLGAVAGALAANTHSRQDPALGARPLRLVDGSTIAGPGSRGTDWRLHVCYDPVAQRFSALEITDAHGAERLERAPVTPGEIRIGDRGFGNRPDSVRAISAGPGDYVVRVNWRGLRWLAPAGGRFDVQDFLVRLGDQPGEAAVLVGSARNKRFAPLPARLIAVPLPAEKAEAARTRAQNASRKAGHRVQPGTLHAAGFLLLLTSLDAAAYPALQVARLYRLRWQVELAIKRLKSLLRLDRLPAKSPALARAWLSAHLIAAFLTDELIRDVLPDAFPSASETPLRSAQRVQGGAQPSGAQPSGEPAAAALALAAGAEPGPAPRRDRARAAVIDAAAQRHAAPRAPLL